MSNKVKPNDYDLRKLQLVEADMLKDFKKICKKHNIKFYLNSGTLLGAVRHKGFIPWDNDIDVEMPYEDYIRFINLPYEEIGEKYFVQTYDTDESWYAPCARFRLNNTTMMYDYEIKDSSHHGIWLDIFPLVEINTGFELKFKRILFKLAKVFNMHDSYMAGKKLYFERKGKKLRTKYDVIYSIVPKKLRKKLARKIMNYIYTAKNKDCYCAVWSWLTPLVPQEFYAGEYTELEFEGEMYPVPPEYDKWLTSVYGDYMTPPPENERVTHDELIVDFDNDYTEYMDCS